MKIPVHQIQSCFMICVIELCYMDANAAVVLTLSSDMHMGGLVTGLSFVT